MVYTCSMKIKPNTVYIVCVTDSGHKTWGRPLLGSNCSSMNCERDTIEQIGIFMAGFVCSDPSRVETIEVFEMGAPVLLMKQGEI